MKSRFFAIVAVMSIAAGLSAASAGQAVARTYQPAKAPPQVSGAKLLVALLPASEFGNTFFIKGWRYTARMLPPNRHPVSVKRLSCTSFENSAIISGFGNTAGATDEFANTNPWSAYPETNFYGYQTVLQFASDRAAASFYAQARAKYAACRSYTVPNPGDGVPGGGSYLANLLSVISARVGHDRGFAAVETIALSERPGVTLFLDVTYATAGTNVYEMWQISGTNDQTTLMTGLISRVQRLYPRR
jgi:hypothetical protein